MHKNESDFSLSLQRTPNQLWELPTHPIIPGWDQIPRNVRMGLGARGSSLCLSSLLPPPARTPTHPSTASGSDTEMDAFLSLINAGPRLHLSFPGPVAPSSLTIPKLPFIRVAISRPAFQGGHFKRYQGRTPGASPCEFAHREGLLEPLSVSLPHPFQAGLALGKKS